MHRVLFLEGHFLFPSSDTFAEKCIVLSQKNSELLKS